MHLALTINLFTNSMNKWWLFQNKSTPNIYTVREKKIKYFVCNSMDSLLITYEMSHILCNLRKHSYI